MLPLHPVVLASLVLLAALAVFFALEWWAAEADAAYYQERAEHYQSRYWDKIGLPDPPSWAAAEYEARYPLAPYLGEDERWWHQ